MSCEEEDKSSCVLHPCFLILTPERCVCVCVCVFVFVVVVVGGGTYGAGEELQLQRRASRTTWWQKGVRDSKEAPQSLRPGGRSGLRPQRCPSSSRDAPLECVLYRMCSLSMHARASAPASRCLVIIGRSRRGTVLI